MAFLAPITALAGQRNKDPNGMRHLYPSWGERGVGDAFGVLCSCDDDDEDDSSPVCRSDCATTFMQPM